MNPDRGSDIPSPGEQKLLRHLHALRQDPPEPDMALIAVVVRRARWQAAVRPFAEAAGRLVAGIGDSVEVMAGRVDS